ncbi:hypothetical protein GCM10027275_40470 [Rhabdobacter roseus]|uniref:Uncharacterized protein n=1 Tax=Rhabdobacter roseus TaxID=1655419 RepID=A0A840TS78_9BACT|nr:hypothetical protein [Rhabdobacter roseus]MBB5285755.1 hypothetical protein [Rhabdobacter roseus]
MKKVTLSALCLLMALGLATSPGSAAIPGQVPTHHWVVEVGPAEQPYTIVRIYSRQNQLVYEEEFPAVRLNIQKARVRRKLNRMVCWYAAADRQAAKVLSSARSKAIGELRVHLV